MSTARAPFRATATLARFDLRRDRVRIVVWIASIALLVVVTVASIKGLYPNRAELVKAARASEDNAAAIILNGPAQGLDTVGGQVAFQVGTYGLILMGLMSIFMLGRLTRGEEEAGRADLLRSLPIGIHSLPSAALGVVAAMNALTGGLVALSLVALGLPTQGSIVFGMSFALFGLLLAALTAVVAQVTENTRVVYGVGGLVLGVAFALRAIGDIGDGSISWLSPIGWAQKVRPFAGERWWPFLVIAAATSALAACAIALSRRRDVGAGLIAPRPGPAHASPALGSPAGLATRLQRASVAGWGAGLLALAVAYGSIADSINDFVQDNQALSDVMATQGRGTLLEQYLAMSFRVLALVGAGFAIQSTMRIAREEAATHAEQLLATPVSRVRFAASHLAIAFVGSFVVLLAAGVGFGAADAAVTGDTAAIGHSVVGAVVYAPALWVLVGATTAAIGLAPRIVAGAWAFLGVCFVIGMFGQLLDLPAWVTDLSPFQHVPSYPAADLRVLPLVVLTALAAALTVVGLVGFRRRDIT